MTVKLFKITLISLSLKACQYYEKCTYFPNNYLHLAINLIRSRIFDLLCKTKKNHTEKLLTDLDHFTSECVIKMRRKNLSQ